MSSSIIVLCRVNTVITLQDINIKWSFRLFTYICQCKISEMETIKVWLDMENDTTVRCVTEPQTAKYLNWVCQRLNLLLKSIHIYPFLNRHQIWNIDKPPCNSIQMIPKMKWDKLLILFLVQTHVKLDQISIEFERSFYCGSSGKA